MPVSLFSKKRLQEIIDHVSPLLKDNNADNLTELKGVLCSIMNFDPEQKIYTPERSQANRKWRQKKAAELGMTEYEFSSKPYRKDLKAKNQEGVIPATK